MTSEPDRDPSTPSMYPSSDEAVEQAQEAMGPVERILKGLPVLRDYVDRELRREADRRLRETIAQGLEGQRQRLYDLQQRLLRQGGLRYLDDVDNAVQRLQILIDRVKHAGSGYAGLFDRVRVREEQLRALYRFDRALAQRVDEIRQAIDRLRRAVQEDREIHRAIDQLSEKVAELNRLLDRRSAALEDPELLQPENAPEVGPEWLAQPPEEIPDAEPSSEEDRSPPNPGP